MPTSTLTSKYQATIPRAVRDALCLGAGDAIEFTIGPESEVRVRKAAVVELTELRLLEAALAPEWSSSSDDAAYAKL